jgi:hypothetical protein
MALTAAQTQNVYLACGLWAEGGTRYRGRWNWFSVFDIKSTSIRWEYDDAKTYVDTRLATLSAGALTLLGTLADTFADTLTSSFEMKGEVGLSDSTEHALAKENICKVVGVEFEPVPPEIVKPLDGNENAGRMVR